MSIEPDRFVRRDRPWGAIEADIELDRDEKGEARRAFQKIFSGGTFREWVCFLVGFRYGRRTR